MNFFDCNVDMIGWVELVFLELIEINFGCVFYGVEKVCWYWLFEYLVLGVFVECVVEEFLIYDCFMEDIECGCWFGVSVCIKL